MEKNQKVGFIAAAPANPDNTTLSTLDKTPPNTIEIGPLLVEPRWGRRGHGSRLLTAAIELAKADGATYALTWLLHGDTASRAFFESAGWEIDGSSRELDMPGRLVREIRLHTDLSEVPIQENNK
jgi:GNAT superfamily N-acetyltransferase